MANERAVLVTELRVDDQLTGKLGAAKGQLTQLDATARKAGSSVGGLGSSLGGIAKAGATAFVAFKALDLASDFLGGSVGAASKLNETMSKSAVIFGQSAGQVAAWGNTAARAFGQSQQQAVEAAATFGNLFKTMGLGQQDVLSMSQRVVELASDLASFNNIGTDEALTKLRSGLVGEAEPLRTLGVQLTEASVKAKAMALGLAGSNGVLSESAKVQARYAIILEQTKTAQGDFGRTTDGLANSQRILAAEVDNIQAKLGAGLTPILAGGAQLLSHNVIPAFELAAAGLGELVSEATRGIPILGEFFHALDGLEKPRPLGIEDFLPWTAAVRKGEEAALALADAQAVQASEVQRSSAAWGLHVGFVNAAANADSYAAAAAIAAAQAQLDAREQVIKTDKAAAAAAALLGDASAELNNDLLTAANGLDIYAGSANAATLATGQLTAAQRTLAANVAAAPFINPRAQPGTGDSLIGAAFSSGGDQGALDQRSGAFDREAARERERQAERERLAEENRRKREAAADKALAEAKRRAEEEARAYEKALGRAFDNAKQRAISLFDTLHNRHVQAIKDAETLAEKQHAGALKVIEDALKFSRFANAAPVTAAQTALDERQQAQSRRGLVESLSAAQLAAQTNTDPKAAADLARALRDATEALENFDDAAKIARLTTVQKTQDDKDAATAAKLTAAADRQLADAKAQAQKDTDAETIAAAKRKKDFETALDKVERASLKAKDTPAEQQAAIAKLEKQFGITTDKSGFHHIDDPLVTAIKNVTIQPPVVYVTSNYNPVFQVSGRAVAVALASGASPTSTPMVRTGAAGRS